MNFDKFQTEDRRLMILRLLAELPGYSANEYVLRAALEDYGHAVSGDRIAGDLAWLTEQGLATTREIASVVIATLTPRGLDVAHGRAVVPGVRRPGPER